jgi:tetratricopeptide (TPR) repeat protein
MSLLVSGYNHLKAGEFDAAESMFFQLLRSDPAVFDTLHLMGVSCRHNGKPQQAIRYLRTACDINPGNASAWLNLGNALQDVRELDSAAQCYANALALDAALAAAHINLGNVRLLQGRAGDALAAFRRAQALAPEHADVQRAIEQVQELLRQRQGAE